MENFVITCLIEDIMIELPDLQTEAEKIASVLQILTSYSISGKNTTFIDEKEKIASEQNKYTLWNQEYKSKTKDVATRIDNRDKVKNPEENPEDEKEMYNSLEDYMEFLETFIEHNRGIPEYVIKYINQVDTIASELCEEELEQLTEMCPIHPYLLGDIRLEDIINNYEEISEIIEHYTCVRDSCIAAIQEFKTVFPDKWVKLNFDGVITVDLIHKDQATTDLVIPKKEMRLLIDEIGQDYKNDLQFTENAYAAIQTVAEDYLIKMLEYGNLNAICSKRDYVLPEDIHGYTDDLYKTN